MCDKRSFKMNLKSGRIFYAIKTKSNSRSIRYELFDYEAAKNTNQETSRIESALQVEIYESDIPRSIFKKKFGDIKNYEYLMIEGGFSSDRPSIVLTSFKIKGRNDLESSDGARFNLSNITEINKSVYEDIFSRIKAKVEETDSDFVLPIKGIIPLVNSRASINLKYEIFNVGQAMATAIRCNEETLMFFDVGLPDQWNQHTLLFKPVFCLKEGDLIVLSHLHSDHWLALADKKNCKSHKITVVIPDQTIKPKINYVLLAINHEKGKVYRLKYDVSILNIGKLFTKSASKYDPSKIAKDYHQTGLTMKLCINKINVLVAGDQEYDYMNITKDESFDYLIASHHGGTYTSNIKKIDIPKPKNSDSKVIFSFGLGNTYKHPSKLNDYIKNKWDSDMHIYTPCVGEKYIII